MKLNKIGLIAIIGSTLLFAGCNNTVTKKTVEEPKANMANPASVFCEKNSGKLEIRDDGKNGQYGICIFDDGSECEEWSYMRNECKPGESLNK